MAKAIFSKVICVGRTTSFLVGLAVILALLFGMASAAFGANGQNFILGSLNNTATALTKLTGNVNGSAMQVVNSNPDANDSALSLNVQSGEAPMKVNSSARVTNLNADKLDGNDSGAFFRGATYMVTSEPTDNSTGSLTNIAVRCDIGDVALGGGYAYLEPNEGTVRADGPIDVSTVFGVHQAWNVQWVNAAPSMDSNVVVMVRCADFGQAHQ
jgi:hypothetical protein